MTFVIQQSTRKPPLTKAQRFQLAKLRTDVIDIDIQVEVLPDGSVGDASKAGAAETSFKIIGSISPNGSFWRSAAYRFEMRRGVDVVVAVTRRAEVKGIVRIQTVYGPDATAEGPSGYGRGTTPQDKFSGNTTLGFHESCHRADFLEYLHSAPFPRFTGKVGMSRADFDDAFRRFSDARAAFFRTMNDSSHRRTDEVGYRKSTYRAKGPQPKGLAPDH